MRKFKIGERARIKNSAYIHTGMDFRGKECTIVRYVPGPCVCGCSAPVYDVAVESFVGRVDEGVLQKMLPDSDTYSKGSWDEFCKIIHQPTKAIS